MACAVSTARRTALIERGKRTPSSEGRRIAVFRDYLDFLAVVAVQRHGGAPRLEMLDGHVQHRGQRLLHVRGFGQAGGYLADQFQLLTRPFCTAG